MKRTIVRWEWWRLGIGSSPRRVWNVNEPGVAGGMAMFVDWTLYPSWRMWHSDEKPYEVRYWKPAYYTSIASRKHFWTEDQAIAFIEKLCRKGYVRQNETNNS